MKKAKSFLLIGIIMLVFAIAFVIYAMLHPTASAGAWIYVVYIVYLVVTVMMFVFGAVSIRRASKK